MLVVDLHALQTIDVLHLVDDVLLHGGRTLNGKDVARRNLSVGQGGACTHGVVLLDKDLTRQWHEVLALLAGLRGDDNLAVAALDLTHRHLTVDF